MVLIYISRYQINCVMDYLKKFIVDEQQYKLLFAFRKQLKMHYNVSIHFHSRPEKNEFPYVLGHEKNVKLVEKFLFNDENNPSSGSDYALKTSSLPTVSRKVTSIKKYAFPGTECIYQAFLRSISRKNINKLKKLSSFSEKCEDYISHNEHKPSTLTAELRECSLRSDTNQASKDVISKRKNVLKDNNYNWQCAKHSLKRIKPKSISSNTSDVKTCELYSKTPVSKPILHIEDEPVTVTNYDFKECHLASESKEVSDITRKRRRRFQDKKCKHSRLEKSSFKQNIHSNISNGEEYEAPSKTSFSKSILHIEDKSVSVTNHDSKECYLASESKEVSDVTRKRKNTFQGKTCKRSRLEIRSLEQNIPSNTSDGEEYEAPSKFPLSKFIFHKENSRSLQIDHELKKSLLADMNMETSENVNCIKKNTFQQNKCIYRPFLQSIFQLSKFSKKCEEYILHNQHKPGTLMEGLTKCPLVSESNQIIKNVTSKRSSIFQHKKCNRWQLARLSLKRIKQRNILSDVEISNKIPVSEYNFHNQHKPATLTEDLTKCPLVSESNQITENVTSKRKSILQDNKCKRWQHGKHSLKQIKPNSIPSDTSDVEICEVSSKTAVSSSRRRSLLQQKNIFSCDQKKSCEEIKYRQEESSQNSETVLQSDSKENIGVTHVAIVRSLSIGTSLRPIVIDGNNVAREYGRRYGVVSCTGIEISVQYFLKRGHTQVTAFVPRYFEHSRMVSNTLLLEKFLKKQYLIYTPSRRISGKCIISYNSSFVVKLALINGGVILSNDNYNNFLFENELSRRTVQERLLKFRFMDDLLMIPNAPLGRKGPRLKEFLSFPAGDITPTARQQ